MNLDPRSVAEALAGEAYGNNIIAPGPGHSRNDRSLSILIKEGAPDGFLTHSFAGDSVAECRDLVLRAVGGRRTEWRSGPKSAAGAGYDDHLRRKKMALDIWNQTKPINGTPAEWYLRGRGLLDVIPSPSHRCIHDIHAENLRFHDGMPHPSGGLWPAMVGLVCHGVTGEPIGIHRTFLAPEGQKAPVTPVKMMLGPCRGGVVPLAKPGSVLLVGEGIETCLSAMQGAREPAWAALSTSGLRALVLPDSVSNVVVLADGDPAGEAAAQEAAERWVEEGRRVRIARPPWGLDFNDVLLSDADWLGYDGEIGE